jgi:hypothetical protein
MQIPAKEPEEGMRRMFAIQGAMRPRTTDLF